MADNGDMHDVNTNGSSPRRRSRSPMRSRSRSRSPRDWKRGERNRTSGRDRPRTSRWGGSGNVTSGGNIGIGGGGGGKVRLYVSNIPYEVRWQDLKDIFKKEVGGEVTYVEMFDGPDGKSMGAGVVEVRTRDAAEKAIEKMHKFEVKGRKIIVREEREKDRIRHQKGGSSGGGMGGGDMMGGGGNMGGGGGMGGVNMGGMNMGGGNMNMGGGGMNMNMSQANLPPGLTPQICAQYNIDPDHITNQVFVANLDYKVTTRKLREIFKMAGNVVSAELKEDKDGNSRGMGVVKFDHPMEAVQAISMFHNQVLYDRALTVKMDKHGDSAFNSPALPSKLPSGLKSIGMGLGQGGQPINVTQLQQTPTFTGNAGNMGGGMGMGNMGMGGMSSMGGMSMNSSNMSTAANLQGMGLNMSNLAGSGGMTSNMAGIGAMGGSGMSGGSSFDGMGGMSMGNMSDMGSMNTSTMSGIGSSLGSSSLSALGSSYSDMGGGSSSLSSMGGRGSGGGGGSLMGAGSSSGIGGSMSGRLSSGMSGSVSGGAQMFEETCTVFVRNLPFSVTWQNLRDQFKECGDVKFAELKMDEQGRSKGYGTVRFSMPEDARRAVNLMNGTRIQGRQIEVRLNKV